jgi:hypothetical protein
MLSRLFAACALLAGCKTAPAPVPIESAPPPSSAWKPEAAPAPVATAVSPVAEPDPLDPKEIRADYKRRCAARVGDPRAWSAKVPFEGSSWDHAERLSVCHWSVSLDGGSLVATISVRDPASVSLPFEPSVRPQYQLVRCDCDKTAAANDPPLRVTDYVPTPQGFLVAYDSGEFGGGLSWFDASGTFRQSIVDENTIRVLATPSGIMAVTRTAHMVKPSGHILRLRWSGRRWLFQKTKLRDEPRGVWLDSDGTLLVVTNDRLLRVGPRAPLTVLHRGAWSDIGPTSVVKDNDGAIYLGARHAVIRLRPGPLGYTEEWLAPEGAESRWRWPQLHQRQPLPRRQGPRV